MYDFIDIAANKQLSKLWEVIPHHLAVSMIDIYSPQQLFWQKFYNHSRNALKDSTFEAKVLHFIGSYM